jgi:mannosylglycerate hydrolase
MARRVDVVPHTHWDREWYAPFAVFRLRLVEVLDGLLALMESDPGYRSFLLDGQMAMVDDYLEVRPENEGRLRRLAAEGRLSVGPWYVLMDEFLVSGETILRNLELGLERAASFGGAMAVGYLPDMFGHIAQMPQILALAGIPDAVVWRGVPSAVERDAFVWEAPDGSAVRAQYLVTGYSEGASVPPDPAGFLRRVEELLARRGEFFDGPVLYPNGTDHEAPQPWLARVVEGANALATERGLGLRFAVSSLPEALAGRPREGLARWRGELRSGARANLLMGVASNRVDVKRAARRAEHALERLAEPLAACFLPPEHYPGATLRLAWQEVVRNAAHDSICACSHDEVVDDVLRRYAAARRVGEAVATRALAALASSLAEPGVVVVNPSARPRADVVEAVLAGDGASSPPGGPGAGTEGTVQVLTESEGVQAALSLSVAELEAVLGQLDSRRVAEDAYVEAVDIEEAPDALEVLVRVGPTDRPELSVEATTRELLARARARPERPVRVRLDQAPARRVVARVGPVPGFGWARLSPVPLEHPVALETEGDRLVLANGLVTVVAGSPDGSLEIDGVPGYDRLVDGGDHGDTYNYSPPEHDALVESPLETRVEALEHGPVRARLRLRRLYRWPERVDDARRARVGEREVEVTTVVELRAEERVVRLATSFVNPCQDHRLRTHFPLPSPAATSRAECAFATVERGLVAEGGPSERGLPTYPSRRFVTAGGLAVVHDGACEYELVDIGDDDLARQLALTLLRSTSTLSRLTMRNRPLPAGPTLPLEGAKMLGPVEARYALALEGRAGPVDPYDLAEDVLEPLLTATSLGGGTRPASGCVLQVAGGRCSSLRRVEGGLFELRVFNPADEPATLEVRDDAGTPVRGHVVDLRGRAVEPFGGSLELRPWQIATLRLAR